MALTRVTPGDPGLCCLHDIGRGSACQVEGYCYCRDCLAWEARALADRLHSSAGACSSSRSSCDVGVTGLPALMRSCFAVAVVVASCLGGMGAAIRAAGVGGGSSRFQLCSHFGGSWAWRSRHLPMVCGGCGMVRWFILLSEVYACYSMLVAASSLPICLINLCDEWWEAATMSLFVVQD